MSQLGKAGPANRARSGVGLGAAPAAGGDRRGDGRQRSGFGFFRSRHIAEAAPGPHSVQKAGGYPDKNDTVFRGQLRNNFKDFTVFRPMLAGDDIRRQQIRDFYIHGLGDAVHPIERQPAIAALELLNLRLGGTGGLRKSCQRHPFLPPKDAYPVLHGDARNSAR